VKGTPGEGTGLGLAIVREIAHRHGAAVDVAAAASGRGTVVAVSFPSRAGQR
jgi:two-component system sensor histidine kinase TctE